MWLKSPAIKGNPETVDVTISVTKEDSTPVESVVVNLGEDYTGTTGSAGGCTIKNVPVGQYTVSVDYTTTETEGEKIWSIAKVNNATSTTVDISKTTKSISIIIQ